MWYIGFPGEIIDKAVEKTREVSGTVTQSAGDIKRRITNSPIAKFALEQGFDRLFNTKKTELDDSLAEEQYGSIQHGDQ